MLFKKIVSMAGVLAIAYGSLAGIAAKAAPGDSALTFTSYVDAGYVEQDVYVQSGTDTNMVSRVPISDAKFTSNLDRQAYAAARAVPHDLFMAGPSAFGPFPRGNALGLTMNGWYAARGTGTYSLDADGHGVLDLRFQGLIPNGIYTILCSRLTTSSKAVSEGTCVALDGSESALKADGQGNSNFRLVLRDVLPMSTADTLTLIGLDYHSDGKTCNGTPCDLGLNSHVQLVAKLPTAREMTKAECLADALKIKNDTMRTARVTLANAQREARKVYVSNQELVRRAYNESVKKANADRRAAETTARADRRTALDRARADFSTDTHAATNAAEREIARERRDMANDKAQTDFDLAMDKAATDAHAALNRAKTTWNADKDNNLTVWDAAKDKAMTDFHTAVANALTRFHTSRLACMGAAPRP